MNILVTAFAAALENIQETTGVRIAARGGAYGSSRLVIIDQEGNEHDYQEALEASETGGKNVQANEN